jgi:inner membrane protein involved in colicin E2 resistance
MDIAQPPVIATPAKRRSQVTLKLLFIGVLVLLLHVPLSLINNLRQERADNREAAHARRGDVAEVVVTAPDYNPAVAAAEGYRMVERALKHSALVLTLVFTAFFLFETLSGLRLHAVHYGLVGAALCLSTLRSWRSARFSRPAGLM